MLKKINGKINYLILLLCSVFFLSPILWIFFTSFKGRREYIKPHLFPKGQWHFENYITSFIDNGLWKFYANSILITAVSVALGLFFASLAGYALTRLKFKSKKVIFMMFLLVMMLPPQLGLIPLFLTFKKMGILYTRWALLLPYTNAVIPLALFMIRGYFKQLPKEMDEAAMIDGADHFTIYWKIIMPLSKPILATACIMTSLSTWNEYLIASTMIKDENMMTIPIGIVKITQAVVVVNEPLNMAAAVLGFLPLLILFIFMQRFFIRGITGGSIK